jgi:hypothetical protein
VAFGADKEDPLPKEKWKVDFLDTCGLELKSVSYKKAEGKSEAGYELLLAFKEDTPVDKLQHVRRLFPPYPQGSGSPSGSSASGASAHGHLEFCRFDEDNVLLGKVHFGLTAGEISGKVGDAFRVFVVMPSNLATKVKKVEVRGVESK